MTPNPNILVTNDDGIHSRGIFRLWEAMEKIGNATVVAPDAEKSAVGHAITISDPIRIQEFKQNGGIRGYSVDGTPADCVKIAVTALCKKPPDIVISGINSGANVGNNIIYSGTVSAATEGTMYNISSIAISLDSQKSQDFDFSTEIAQKVVKAVLKNGLPKGTLLNVNVPAIRPDKIKGIKITKQGHVFFKDRFEKREDPRGRQYYWMTGEIVNPVDASDLDSSVLKDGYVSITPIHYELTNNSFLESLNDWDFS